MTAKKFREIKTGKDDKSIAGINCIYSNDGKLFVGTFANGLWIFQNGIWSNFTTENGLLSNRVIGTAVIGENFFVGTDLGVSQAKISELDQVAQAPFQQSISIPTLSAISKQNEQLILSKDNGEIFVLDGNSNRLTRDSLTEISWKKPEDFTNSRLFSN